MKKKTKYKSNNDFTLFFVIAVLLCLCSALYFSYRFYESFFNSLTKHETPIATITFKKRVAQRKFADRVVWDRLKQSSPVYNGDTIRTAINSEATLNFQNGASLELQENTLAQFFAKDDGSFLANLAGGSFTANAMEEGSSLQVSSSMGVLDIQEGSSLYMQEGGGNVTLDVLNGSARLENGESVFEGQSISLEEDGYSLLPLTVLSPSQNAKILYSTLAKDGSYPVRFLWKKTEEMGDIVLTVSSDIGFTKGLQKFVLKNVTEKTVKLQDGSYYWKFENDSGALLVRGKLQLLKTNPPAIKSPLNNSTYEYSATLPDIRFSWSDVQEARTYYVTVSKNKDLSDPLFERPCMTASMSVSSLEEGTYYWQVVPSFSLRAYGERASSKIQSFKVVKKASTLKKPLLLLPKDENVINISSVKQVRFSWQQDKEARSYKIVVSQNSDLRSPLIEETVTNSFFAYKDVLKNGKYYWNVTAVDDLGATNTSAVNSFFVEQTNVEQRTVFPPDKYSIWSQVLTNVNFTWKTSIPENLRFQISRDESFSSVIYDLQKPHDVISGIKLKDGTYYWRIKSNTESAEYVTKPKMFTVVPNLEKAHFTSPRESSPVIEKDGKP
ncbi:MAG: DUF4962 domain-containing protein, partial [Treponema sp.]|nr:DUF4962 domain-containing protein [Treponema sp.]